MKCFLLGLTLCCCHLVSLSQQSKIDSLEQVLKTAKEDTNKINILYALGRELMDTKPDTAIIVHTQALQLAEKQKWEKGIGKSYYILGLCNYYKSDYPLALNYYFKALAIWEKLENDTIRNPKSLILNHKLATLGNIGIVYWNQGDYPKALDYCFKVLKIAEELEDKNKIASILSNIGVMYMDQGDYPKALDYYFRALKLDKELGNKNRIGITLGNIGVVYWNQGDYPKALDHYFKALKINEELENQNGIGLILGNIGLVYWSQGDYPKALDYYFKALKMAEGLGDKIGVARHLGNIGLLYIKVAESLPTLKFRQTKYNEAEDYLQRALALCNSLGALNLTKEFEESLSKLYSQTGKYQLALEHYQKYVAARDTIFSEENKKKSIRVEMNFEFEKKEAATKADHEKQIAIGEAEKKRQQIVIWTVGGGLLLVMFFAGLILRSLRITKKQKHIIELQKNEVTKQKEIVEEQKHLVEEHQKEITDSIKYARRLQQAILPPAEFIKKHLPDSFILYKPKDIVAGDFYWMEVINNTVFIAAADCTGHGVPGAMVSVVCSNALNRAVKEFGLLETGKILDKVTELVLETFEKSGEEINDGMDISLLRIGSPVATETLPGIQWSGANNPLWYILNGELKEIKADKQPVGKFENRKEFTTHHIENSNNLFFYLFSDGFSDQFGGTKGKKFMHRQFKEVLTTIYTLSMEEQEEKLEKVFQEWKGALEQVDDVTIIGIRL